MSYPRLAVKLAVAAVGLVSLASVPAQAQINGFNSGGNYTINATANYTPLVSNTVYQATDDKFGDSSSIYYNTKQNITNWTADFTYTDVLSNGSDGFTFNLQNQGLTARGNNGSGLDYGDNGTGETQTGITPSAAIAFNIYSGYGRGTKFVTDGANPLTGGYLPTGAVDIGSGDPIAVHLAYDGTTLSESLTDTATSMVFQTSYAANLPSILGGNTAYVGFSGATGGAFSTQQISNFLYTPSAAVPEASTTLSFGLLLALGLGSVLIAARRKRAA